VRCGLSLSAFIVDRDGVAVRVSERERPAEGTIDRLSQDRQDVDVTEVDVDRSVGYALKRAQHALHGAMDGELRDYGLSVSQYAALQILASRPRISNADLARDAFVSRQAMHQLLTGLQATGLVTAIGQGRSQRYALMAEGHTRLRTASSTVAAIEQRMIATLSRAEREQLHRQLSICATALDSH